jgi:hypothetical protein
VSESPPVGGAVAVGKGNFVMNGRAVIEEGTDNTSDGELMV